MYLSPFWNGLSPSFHAFQLYTLSHIVIHGIVRRGRQTGLVVEMELKQRDDCTTCPYSAGSTYQEPPNASDPQCFQQTEKAFLGSLLLGEENVTTSACQYLKDNNGGGDLFWALYHLDTTYCGLAYINGQPNLDRKFEDRVVVFF